MMIIMSEKPCVFNVHYGGQDFCIALEQKNCNMCSFFQTKEDYEYNLLKSQLRIAKINKELKTEAFQLKNIKY